MAAFNVGKNVIIALGCLYCPISLTVLAAAYSLTNHNRELTTKAVYAFFAEEGGVGVQVLYKIFGH